jgi:hypothetical protein
MDTMLSQRYALPPDPRASAIMFHILAEAIDEPRQDITLAFLRSFQLHSGSSSTTLPTS